MAAAAVMDGLVISTRANRGHALLGYTHCLNQPLRLLSSYFLLTPVHVTRHIVVVDMSPSIFRTIDAGAMRARPGCSFHR